MPTIIYKSLCSNSMSEKTKRFEVRRSLIISTQVSKCGNGITGKLRAVKFTGRASVWEIILVMFPYDSVR